MRILWRGTLEETKRITTNPVPESYRRRYGETECQNLVKSSLIDWHLEFGNEGSTSDALKFLAETALEGMPSMRRFDRELVSAWRAAQNEAKRSRHYFVAPKPDWEGGRQALQQSVAVRRLQSLMETHRRFQLLATAYLRAAELFRSTRLLEIGTRYFGPTLRGIDVLCNGSRIAMADGLSPFENFIGIQSLDINGVRDLEMRYAIARARISRSSTDLAAAAAAVQANGDPIMRDAAEPLIDRAEDVCESLSASNALRAACKRKNNLAARLRSFWRNAAQVELLADDRVSTNLRTPFSSFDIAMKAIAAESPESGSDLTRYTASRDDEVALFLARAEDRYRRSNTSSSPGDDAERLRAAALDDLTHAERLTPAALNPNRFRQIADLYLQIYGSTLRGEFGAGPQQARQAAYLRDGLGSLNDIAGGSEPRRTPN